MKAILTLLLLINLAACATKVVGLKKSPTFTGQSLIAEGISIVGVVSTQGNLSESEKLELGNELKAQIIEKKPEIKRVLAYGGVRQTLGEKKHDQVLKDFSQFGSLSEDSKKSLLQAKIPTRYFALVLIESDNVEKSRSDFQEKDSYGVVSIEKTKVRANIRRNVVANYHIYDSQNGEVAWGGVIEKSIYDSRDYTKDKDPGLVQLVKAFKGTNNEQDPEKLYPYPETPALRKVMSASFAGFAESLPKVD